MILPGAENARVREGSSVLCIMSEGYYYTKDVLQEISEHYFLLYYYEALRVKSVFQFSNAFPIIEKKADFDIALNAIGRGRWDANNMGERIEDYKYFGRLQQVVIADIIGVEDYDLERLGFYRIPQMRGYAYHLMADRLNGKVHHGTKTQFKAKTLDTVIRI